MKSTEDFIAGIGESEQQRLPVEQTQANLFPQTKQSYLVSRTAQTDPVLLFQVEDVEESDVSTYSFGDKVPEIVPDAMALTGGSKIQFGVKLPRQAF